VRDTSYNTETSHANLAGDCDACFPNFLTWPRGLTKAPGDVTSLLTGEPRCAVHLRGSERPGSTRETRLPGTGCPRKDALGDSAQIGRSKTATFGQGQRLKLLRITPRDASCTEWPSRGWSRKFWLRRNGIPGLQSSWASTGPCGDKYDVELSDHRDNNSWGPQHSNAIPGVAGDTTR
jgi:hypothetical protein